MPTSAKLIKKNIARGISKEDLLLANYLHFKLPLQEARDIVGVFSLYFENNILKNDTRELATHKNTAYNFFEASSVDHARNA